MNDLGTSMHSLCAELFPICRSITGSGVRKTLSIIKGHLPNLTLHEVPSGTRCFDWVVPREWNIHDAAIIDQDGKRIVDFKESNLHIVGYSIPVNKTLPLEELDQHLHSLPDQPQAIPYVTSYYHERWGFCLRHDQRMRLKPGNYKVHIDSELSDGFLTYAELLLPGASAKEVFISSYICHPSMANNELSGPVVTTFLARWLAALPARRYTYRIVLIPETIGSIVYLSRHHAAMRENIVAGFNVTCIGDDRAYSYLPSRHGATLADQAALHTLQHLHPEFKRYSFLDRGSDERQYCSPGIDLPVCSVMRTKYGQYPEYHTSLDNLDLVTPTGLFGGYDVLQKTIECIERNETLRTTVLCEPQMGRRGLYPTLSQKGSGSHARHTMNFLAYADGKRTALEIADIINVPLWELINTIERLKEEGILEVVA